MAKKWSKKEINEYLSTKQISQENYVAPTVQTNYQPSIESTVNAFNSVQPTVSQPKIQTTVKQPTIGEGLGYVGESALSGFTSGATSLLDAPLQNVQEGTQKAKNKSVLDNYKQLVIKNMLPANLGRMVETFSNLRKIANDKDKTGWQKTLSSGMEVINSLSPVTKISEDIGQLYAATQKAIGRNGEKDVQKAREVIETPGNKLQEDVAKKSENMSKGWNIAGQTSQTIGNMLPSIAVSAITKNPDIGLAAMGVSAKGQATKEAEEKGATLNEANKIGLAKGLVEVGTEKLTGGLKFFGKGTADDVAEDIINRTIKNKTGNFIAKQGLGIGGEVFEETLSDLVGTAIDKATVDPNATYTFDDWKNTALMTVLSTGALNTLSGGYSRSAYQLNTQELEQIAQNEKVQQTVEARVNELKTPDMTPEQIENLKIDVRADILGDIQDNINNIVNETQNITQIPTQTPLNEVNQGVLQQNNQILGQGQTPQITPLNQVNQELQETRQQDVADSVKAMNLETEPQFTQKQGNYVYEKSDNSKIDNLRKDAATYLKEGEQTTNFVNTLEKLVKDKDIEIRFDTKLGNNVNGTYKNGVITINPNSNRAGEFVAIHELTHAIGTKPMIDMIQTYRKSNAEFNSAVERLLSTYKTTEINEEALGDIAGQLFGNQEYINNLSMENPSLFKKIYNEIKYLWHQFTGYKNQDQFIEDLRNKWESAYRNQKVQQKAKNSNIEMSTQTDSNGNMLSNEQVDYFKDSKVRDENGNLLVMYHGTEANVGLPENEKFTVFDRDKAGNNGTYYGAGFYFTSNSEYANDFAKGKGDVYKVYLKMENPYKPTADTINTDGSVNFAPSFYEDFENRFKNDISLITDWSSLTNKQKGRAVRNILQDNGYDGIVNGNNYVVFESNQIKNIDNLTPTKNDDIRYSKEELKKEPIKDNTGRKLSKQQQEYFKDTKIRDNNGNLITVYHTMTDRGPQFNEFDARGTENYRFGDQTVNFFTNSKTMSGSYADYKYSQTDNSKFTNLDEIKNWLKEQNTLFDEYDIKPTNDGKYYITESGKGKIIFDSKEQLLKNAKQKFYEYRKQFGSDKGIDNYQYEGYVNITNPYVIDGKGANWDDILTDYNKLDVEYANRISQEDKERLIEIAKESQAKEKEKSQRLYEIKEEVYDGRNEKYRTIRGIEDVERFKNDVLPQLKGKYKEKISNLLDEYEKLQKTPVFEDDYFRNNEETKEILDKINNEFNMSYSDYDLYRMAKNDFDEEQLKNIFGKRNSTNEIVKDVLEKNKNGSNYDGVIIKNIMDYGSTTEFDDNGAAQDVYVTFNSNQFKNVDNTNPTNDPDIRYSKDNQTWREYLEKEFPSQGTRTNLGEVAGRKQQKTTKPTTETKTTQEQPKNPVEDSVKAMNLQNKQNKQEVKDTNKALNLAKDNKYKEKLYHGTDEIFDEYDIDKFGKHDQGDFGQAVYFTKNKNTASKYGKNIKTTDVELDNPYVINSENDYAKLWHEVAQKVDKNNLSKEDLELYNDKYTPQKEKDFMLYDTLNAKEKRNIIKNMGYDGIVDNTYNQVAVFDTDRINKNTINENKQEIKKSYLTSAEQNELDGLKAVENSGFAELTKEEQARMEELEKKSQGITKKFPELNKTVTQEDTKPLYFKYKDNEISRENNKILNEAKKIVESNKQGRRTKEQWLQVAEYIGSNADIKNSTDLQKLAMETWLASKPNTKDNLNRQGKKYVDFKTNEWFNAMYKGAGVGTDVKLSQEERNIINESKQDDVVVLRTPTEIQPKEVKTPEQKQEYFEESGTPKKVAKILSETPRETETSSLREMYQAAKRAVVDKGEAIYRIAKQTKNRRLYAMYDRIGLATGEGNSDIGISQTNLDGESYKNFTDSKGNKTSMSLNDIWKDVEDSNIPENVMNEYLANYLNVDRYKANQLSIEEIEELKDLNKYKNLSKTQKERVEELNTLAETRNVFGKDITREDSLNKIKEIEEKYPQIKRPAENIWQYGKNQLQKMVDAGLVSKESQEYYNENTPHYVRLQRSTESKKGSVFDSKGHLQVNNQIKKAKGGTKDIIPFKDSMAQYTLDTTSSIRKNLFGQELSKTLKNGLETDGNVDIDNIDNNILNANEDGSYTFKIFKDGKPEVLTIDKGIYEALQPNKHYELEKLFTPFRAVSNFKRTVLTDKNPLFLATNFFKDFFDAPLNTKHSTVDFVKNYGVAINQILKNGEYYQKYQALGGNQNTYFDKEGFSKPSKISKIVAPIEKANEFIEMLPRMSEFITSLKKGESLDEAMYNAAEITTNFKRGGTATKIVNRNGATFLNASVQGFDKQIRNFTEIQNPKQAVRLMTKALVLGVAPALLNAVMYDDDDEYDDLPDYVKDSYYLFKTGKDNKWIRIPKGRAISVIQSAARRTYDYSKGNKEAFKGLAGHFENQLAPNNPLESNVLSPLVDVKNNKAWSGNKIVSDSIANASHPEEEYDAKTDELSKWLGKKLGKSPKKINYIIDQNTGAIGDLLLPFLTKQAEGEDDSIAGRLLKNPIKDKFSTDAVLNSKQVNQFYDAFNKAEDDKKWSKATDEDKLKYKYLYSTMLELAEKNKQIKEIESSDKSDKEKYRETKAIKQEMNDMSKKAVKESENIKINDYYAQIDDKVYKKEYDKSTGEYKYTKVQQKQLDKIKDKGVPLSDYFQEAYEKQKKRATK